MPQLNAYSRGQLYGKGEYQQLRSRIPLASSNASSVKGVRWCLVGLTACFFCFLIYMPLLYTISVTEVPVFDWNINASRDVSVYVQPENLTALISNPHFCSHPNHSFLLLIVVCSGVDRFEARVSIRETWASFQYAHLFNDSSTSSRSSSSFKSGNMSSHVKVAFLLGETKNSTLQDKVLEESDMYGDVIQEGFLDSYLNLTLKSVMLLKWADAHCPQARFVMKTDDDMFVNVGNLVQLTQHKETEKEKEILMGSLFCNPAPINDKYSKWYSPKFMFQGRVYPDYLSGCGYVMSKDTVWPLFRAALEVPFFHLEDVFVTGMVAKKVNFVPQNIPTFNYLKVETEPCTYRGLITSHGLTPDEQRAIWTRVHDANLDCSHHKYSSGRDAKLKHCPKKSGKKRQVHLSAVRRGNG